MLEFLISYWHYWALWVLVLSLIGFATMGIDKYKAKKDLWRIPEKNLFLVAILGGSIGSMLGMKVFRHKTQHKIFQYGMPAIFIIQLVASVAVVVWAIAKA